jgi:hypothetical protein
MAAHWLGMVVTDPKTAVKFVGLAICTIRSRFAPDRASDLGGAALPNDEQPCRGTARVRR